MSAPFNHLHVHSEYSLLDGAARIDELVQAAAADGQPALGLTDHGNLYGAVPFWQACRAHGVNPIIGLEAYMARERRDERPRRQGTFDDGGGASASGGKLYYHLTLLAETTAGYHNLIQLASRGYTEGYWYKPRIDWEVLAAHADGLLAATGCLGGHVGQALLAGDPTAAIGHAARLRDIFGPDRLYVELQDHGLQDQKAILPGLLRIAADLDLPLLATNDCHYTHRADAAAHDALLCVQTGAHRNDPGRFRFDGAQWYLKPGAEMRALFADHPAACDNTLEVGERCHVEIPLGGLQLPRFPLPDHASDPETYLAELTHAGAAARWGAPLPRAVQDRLSYELQVIGEMGFAPYFLIVDDLIRHARSRGIRVGPGRGSAAGCAVAYALGITNLDPLRYDLLFERFLNPGRRQLPDIDVDFDSRHRDDLIRYAAERYGRDHVAQVVTFATIKGRAAVRDAARVLDMPYKLGDRVAKAVPEPIMGRTTPLAACLERDPEHAEGYAAAGELRRLYAAHPDVRAIVDTAQGLEGLRRQDSIHAAAVVIAAEPLTASVPVQRKPGPGAEAPLVTQYDMDVIEQLGLLKMDFLGLRTLDVLTDTVAHLQERGAPLDLDALPLDDAATYALLQSGDTTGVFQLESAPMRALLRTLAPSNIDDVAAAVALYRPGPLSANMHTEYADRKHGRTPVSVIHPDAGELLKETYGVMIYQEQMMRIAQHFAGYSLEDADNLRKACGKKIRHKMAEEKEKFLAGCAARGYGGSVGAQWWSLIEPFADYAFNKSHSYAYGLIAYQTAYLRANHPVEYAAALLTSVQDKPDRLRQYLLDCQQRGITVAVPDVNESQAGFAPASAGGETRVRFGLAAIRHVGGGDAGHIVAGRHDGPYRDFADFCNRVDPAVLNKRTITSLISAGAFDSLTPARRTLLDAQDKVVDNALRARRDADRGVVSLFAAGAGSREELPHREDDPEARLRGEHEVLGVYLTGHPLDGQPEVPNVTPLADIAAAADGDQVRVAGAVSGVSTRETRRGDTMARFTLSDRGGQVPVVGFGDVASVGDHDLVILECRVDRRDGDVTLVGSELVAAPNPDGPRQTASVAARTLGLSL